MTSTVTNDIETMSFLLQAIPTEKSLSRKHPTAVAMHVHNAFIQNLKAEVVRFVWENRSNEVCQLVETVPIIKWKVESRNIHV